MLGTVLSIESPFSELSVDSKRTGDIVAETLTAILAKELVTYVVVECFQKDAEKADHPVIKTKVWNLGTI